MSDNTRKASEVLLELEQKIEQLTKVVYAYDMNIKLILGKVNEISKALNISQIATQQTFQSLKPTPIATEPMKNNVVVRTPTPPVVEVKSEKVKEIEKKSGISNDRKVPVVQRVTDHTGKDLFMANVLIYDQENNEVEKSKTNAVGKWQSYLKPGKYRVNISKTGPDGNKVIDSMQEFVIGENEQSLKLNTAIIKRL